MALSGPTLDARWGERYQKNNGSFWVFPLCADPKGRVCAAGPVGCIVDARGLFTTTCQKDELFSWGIAGVDAYLTSSGESSLTGLDAFVLRVCRLCGAIGESGPCVSSPVFGPEALKFEGSGSPGFPAEI